MSEYVHGYSTRETQRLQEQAGILEELLHEGTSYPAGSRVLEVGCGVGGQTVLLAERSPGAEFVSIDLSPTSLDIAQAYVDGRALSNVQFRQADIMSLPFENGSFDHVFVCFVLEHVPDPVSALIELRRVVRGGGSVTVIEGDHGACVWHPETEESLKVWHSLISVQGMLGHDPLVGRGLYPLLTEAGLDVREVSPKAVYGDALRPELLDGVVNKIIVPMTETACERAIEWGLIDKGTWEKGIADLKVSGMPPDGTFFYTWFKAVALKG